MLEKILKVVAFLRERISFCFDCEGFGVFYAEVVCESVCRFKRVFLGKTDFLSICRYCRFFEPFVGTSDFLSL